MPLANLVRDIVLNDPRSEWQLYDSMRRGVWHILRAASFTIWIKLAFCSVHSGTEYSGDELSSYNAMPRYPASYIGFENSDSRLASQHRLYAMISPYAPPHINVN
jgi:hypothetical protein